MNRLGYHAANVGERDLAMGYEEFERRTAAAQFPFVSANIVRQDTGQPAFTPYVVVEVAGRDGQMLKVGVTGLVRFNPVFLKAGPDGNNLVIAPPSEALTRYIEELREQSDLVVVLAALHRDDAHLVARTIGGIDLILGSYGSIYSTNDANEGRTLIYYSGNQGRRIGETRLFVAHDKSLRSATSYMHFLTARYPSDPEMLQYVSEASARIKQHKQTQQQAQGAAGVPRPAAGSTTRADGSSG